jgi:hypothetical protein
MLIKLKTERLKAPILTDQKRNRSANAAKYILQPCYNKVALCIFLRKAPNYIFFFVYF